MSHLLKTHRARRDIAQVFGARAGTAMAESFIPYPGNKSFIKPQGDIPMILSLPWPRSNHI